MQILECIGGSSKDPRAWSLRKWMSTFLFLGPSINLSNMIYPLAMRINGGNQYIARVVKATIFHIVSNEITLLMIDISSSTCSGS